MLKASSLNEDDLMAFNKLKLGNFTDELDMAQSMLICRASFETRSTQISNAFSGSGPKAKLVFYSRNESKSARMHRDEMTNDNALMISLPTRDPLATDAKMKNAISDLLNGYTDEHLLVDITCFRREELLILIRILHLCKDIKPEKIQFAYIAAEGMGSWLSKNPRSTRSVVGFPGDMDPLRPTHLIILLGFEDHRVKEIINSYEPKNISLGISTSVGAVSDYLHERNLKTRDHLMTHFGNITRKFDFSATDPSNVMKVLGEIVELRSDHNSIIAPLHTKLSTLGAGMFALRFPKVQVCYTEVEEYNTKDFSEKSDNVFLGNLVDLK